MFHQQQRQQQQVSIITTTITTRQDLRTTVEAVKEKWNVQNLQEVNGRVEHTVMIPPLRIQETLDILSVLRTHQILQLQPIVLAPLGMAMGKAEDIIIDPKVSVKIYT